MLGWNCGFNHDGELGADIFGHGSTSWSTRRATWQYWIAGWFSIYPWHTSNVGFCIHENEYSIVSKQWHQQNLNCAQEQKICVLGWQVSKATEHITAGTTALVNSKKLQRKTRKYMCLAIILLLVTATIIVLVVVQPWKKKSWSER